MLQSDNRKRFRPGALQKALRTACHPNTSDPERLNALRLIHSLDDQARFIDMIDSDFNLNSTAEEWRSRVHAAREAAEEKDKTIKARDAEIARLNRQLAKRQRPAAASDNGETDEKAPDKGPSASKMLPYPMLQTKVLYLRIADKVMPCSWFHIKRAFIEYLWEQKYVKSVEELLELFNLIVEGDATAGQSRTEGGPHNKSFVPHIGPKGITLKSASAHDVWEDIRAALDKFDITYELFVEWKNVRKAKQHGSAGGQHSLPAAFPGDVARFTSVKTMDYLLKPIALLPEN